MRQRKQGLSDPNNYKLPRNEFYGTVLSHICGPINSYLHIGTHNLVA